MKPIYAILCLLLLGGRAVALEFIDGPESDELRLRLHCSHGQAVAGALEFVAVQLDVFCSILNQENA